MWMIGRSPITLEMLRFSNLLLNGNCSGCLIGSVTESQSVNG